MVASAPRVPSHPFCAAALGRFPVSPESFPRFRFLLLVAWEAIPSAAVAGSAAARAAPIFLSSVEDRTPLLPSRSQPLPPIHRPTHPPLERTRHVGGGAAYVWVAATCSVGSLFYVLAKAVAVFGVAADGAAGLDLHGKGQALAVEAMFLMSLVLAAVHLAMAYRASSREKHRLHVIYRIDIEAFKPEEIAGIIKDFDEPRHLAPTGLFLGGTKASVALLSRRRAWRIGPGAREIRISADPSRGSCSLPGCCCWTLVGMLIPALGAGVDANYTACLARIEMIVGESTCRMTSCRISSMSHRRVE
ncbi:hypothetical protein ZWY2020_056700 [Hordeum vulgare]|nr:hypothetical protein ZWY2020_056700 [Hordeum vulgare]